jgi:hypothetical protein
MSDPTTPPPFQPTRMTTAQLAAVSYLARYTGRTHTLYAIMLRQWFRLVPGQRAGPADVSIEDELHQPEAVPWADDTAIPAGHAWDMPIHAKFSSL